MKTFILSVTLLASTVSMGSTAETQGGVNGGHSEKISNTENGGVSGG